MPDIKHTLQIKASIGRVFDGISAPQGLDIWWTKSSAGVPQMGEEYSLFFGPSYDWRAKVTKCQPDTEFELEITDANENWKQTRVGFKLSEMDSLTLLEFYHSGWEEGVENFRVSSYCWAMYLRILKRYLEHGETVQYEKRLDV